MAVAFNFLWAITLGWMVALGWTIVAALAAISVVFAPWAASCLRIAGLAFWPFGYTLVSESDLSLQDDTVKSGTRGALNIVWFVFVGWWLALSHLFAAFSALFACVFIITIPVCIPLAMINLKLAGAALMPVGKRVVKTAEAKYIQESAAKFEVEKMREKSRGHSISRSNLRDTTEGYGDLRRKSVGVSKQKTLFNRGPDLVERTAVAVESKGWAVDTQRQKMEPGTDLLCVWSRVLWSLRCVDEDAIVDAELLTAVAAAKTALKAHFAMIIFNGEVNPVIVELARRSKIQILREAQIAACCDKIAARVEEHRKVTAKDNAA